MVLEYDKALLDAKLLSIVPCSAYDFGAASPENLNYPCRTCKHGKRNNSKCPEDSKEVKNITGVGGCSRITGFYKWEPLDNKDCCNCRYKAYDPRKDAPCTLCNRLGKLRQDRWEAAR